MLLEQQYFNNKNLVLLNITLKYVNQNIFKNFMKIKKKKITLVLQKLFSCLKNSWRAVVTVGSCSPLHTASLDFRVVIRFLVSVLTKASLCQLLSLGSWIVLTRVLFVLNLFHLKIMELTTLLGTVSRAEHFLQPCTELCIVKPHLWPLHRVPLTLWPYFCSDVDNQVWSLL